MNTRLIAMTTVASALAACGQAGPVASTKTSGGPVDYEQVQALFDTKCAGCHPNVMASLDLTGERSYEQLVGVPATEAPTLYRVIAGDPGNSFLFMKIAGREGLGNDPGVGGRMPQGQGPLSATEVDLVRRWIEQGALGPGGRTPSPPTKVLVPGDIPGPITAAPATAPDGSGTITGSVFDDQGSPIAGAIVTELVVGADQPQGEEHYRAATTGPDGTFTMTGTATGRVLLKVYAPRKVYTSYIAEVPENGTATVMVGVATDALETPTISAPSVETAGARTTLSVDVRGTRLDRNYTLAINRTSGLVVELHGPNGGDRDESEGRWSATIDNAPTGEWTFVAVDHGCNASDFLTASA